MARFRSSSLTGSHAQLGAAALHWAQLGEAASLRHYGFRHGVAHLLASGQSDKAEGLLRDFSYGLARLEREQGAGARSLSQDATAVLNTAQHTRRFELWEDFFRTRVHLLERGSGDWGAQKILLQLAVEHADDSPITQAAESWLDEGHCDWLWLRRRRRRRSAAPGPCLRTLAFHDEEPMSLQAWSSRLVYLAGSGCQLVVMDGKCESAELIYEAQDSSEQVMGVLTQHPGYLIFWTEVSIWVWAMDWPEPRRHCHLPETFIHWVVATGNHDLIIATEDGDYLRSTIADPEPQCLYQGEDVAQDGFATGDQFIVFRLGIFEDDEDQDDEDEDDEDDADFDEEDSWDETENGDEDEAWDEEEEEGEGDCPQFAVLNLQAAADEKPLTLLGSGSDVPIRSLHELAADHVICLRHDGCLESWDIGRRTRTQQWNSPEDGFHDLRIVEDRIVVWGLNGTIYILEASTLQLEASLEGHSDLVSDVIPYGEEHLLSCGHDGEIRRWDLDTMSCVRLMKGESPHGLTRLKALDQDRVLTWGFDNFMTVWNVATGNVEGVLSGHSSSLSEVIILSPSMLASCADFASDLKIWNLTRLNQDTPLDEHRDVVAFAHRQHHRLLTGAHDATLRLWDLNEGQLEKEIRSTSGPVTHGIWLDDERFVSITNDLGMTGAFDGPTLGSLWCPRHESAFIHYEGHEDWINGVVALDECRLLTWSDDGSLRVWAQDTGDCLQTLEGHDGPVTGGCSLGGREWLSWSEDGTLRHWNLSSGRCVRVFRGHDTGIVGATRLPGGEFAAWDEAAEGPATVRIWSGEKEEAHTALQHDVEDCFEVAAVTSSDDYIWVDYAHGPILAWQRANPRATPTVWSGLPLQQLHPQVAQALIDADSNRLRNGQHVAHTTAQRLYLDSLENQTLHWSADGEWRLHDLHNDGMLIASCWNQIAFLQLHHGNRPVSLAKAEDL